jgi:mannitol-1-phosphate 5-dehydrogenase
MRGESHRKELDLKQAVHFGAGNIGRGFLGQLYFESGYHTVFVDVMEEVVAGLQARHEYPLRVVSETSETRTIQQVDAVHGGDVAAVAAVVAQADMVSTAVGVAVLEHIVPALAKGIERRFSTADAPPLNVIVCENLLNAGDYLREKVRARLAPPCHAALDEKVGFVEASIGRMVPVMSAEVRAEDPLLVCVEPYCALPVDRDAFKGPLPELKHMQARSNFKAYVERKLFVHNMSHAATAYLGYLRGHEYIWQAVGDPAVRALSEAAAIESCQALTAKWGLDAEELAAHREDLLHRYANRALGDQVSRVARDPLRKLGAHDRLAGAARLCIEQGHVPTHIAIVWAAALHYDHADDPAALQLQAQRQETTLAAVLQSVSGVESDSPLIALVADGEAWLKKEGWL